jgi:hypothetical protein
MKLYTIQNGKYRKAKGQFVDTTVKTGVVYFAPTWDMVLQYKNKIICEDVYISLYTNLMRQSFKDNNLVWLKLFDFEEITLGCYCKAGDFCHRHLLVEMLLKIGEKYNRPVEYCGEVE